MDSNLLKKLKEITLKSTTTNQIVSKRIVQEEKSTRRRRRGAIEHIDDKVQINMLKEQL